MEKKHTFNEVANEYEKFRPGYPDPLFRDILTYSSIGTNASILEIGCGTGQATQGFVELGYDKLTCVELGPNLAERTREKFKTHSNVKVINSSFEEWPCERERFDLAISATAFHFIQPQELGYRKVFGLLRDQGSLAFFWTVHIPAFDPVFNQIRECYRKYAPHLDDSLSPSLEQIIEERTELTLQNGLFQDLSVKVYRWNRAYSAEAYVSLIDTNSRHRLLPDPVRLPLLDSIKHAIERHGGTVTKPEAVALFLARKSCVPTE